MSNRKNLNFSEYQFKGNYNSFCNFPNPTSRTSLNNNIIGNFKNPLVSREQLKKMEIQKNVI